MGWDVPDAAADIMMLRKRYRGKQAAHCQQSNKFLHIRPSFECPGRFY
jgi:hypothetical protein